MATGILLICVLSCVVATSVGNYLEYSKAFDELNSEVRKIRQESMEEVQSLHQKINSLKQLQQQFELELAEVKGEIGC